MQTFQRVNAVCNPTVVLKINLQYFFTKGRKILDSPVFAWYIICSGLCDRFATQNPLFDNRITWTNIVFVSEFSRFIIKHLRLIDLVTRLHFY